MARVKAKPVLARSKFPTELMIVAGLVIAACGDVFHLGFFSDDFIFLDAARRFPIGEVLLGQHGVWPWYRPLARELYFYIIVAAGPAGLFVAHTLSILCLVVLAWGLYRLGERLIGWRPAGAACALLVSYATTKLLVGWAAVFRTSLPTRW